MKTKRKDNKDNQRNKSLSWRKQSKNKNKLRNRKKKSWLKKMKRRNN